jgi:hypothetical protein
MTGEHLLLGNFGIAVLKPQRADNNTYHIGLPDEISSMELRSFSSGNSAWMTMAIMLQGILKGR